MVRCRVTLLFLFVLWCFPTLAQTVTTVPNPNAPDALAPEEATVPLVQAVTVADPYYALPDSTVQLPYQDANGNIVSTEDAAGNVVAPASSSIGYSAGVAFGTSDQTFECLRLAQGGKGVNCWYHLPGAVSMIASGGGKVLGQAGSTIYQLLPTSLGSTGHWVATSLPPVKYIAIDREGMVYGLNTGGVCDSGNSGYNIFIANAALTAWSLFPGSGCVTQISVGNDGTVVGVNNQHDVWSLPAGGTSWHRFPSYLGAWNKVADVDGTAAFALSTVGQIYELNLSTGTATYINGWGTDIGVTKFGVVWVVGGSNSAGNAYSWDSVHAAVGAWNQYVGFISQIAVDSDTTIFGLSSNYIYHFNRRGLLAKSQTSGSWQCPPNGCPAGSYHTAYATASFSSGGAHGTAGVTSSYGSSPEAFLSTTATELGTQCDMFFGDPNSISCVAGFWSRVFCSVMGTIFSMKPGISETQAKTKSSLNGTGVIQWDDSTNCPVISHCAPGGGPTGDPPLAPFSIINQRPSRPFTVAACYPFYWSTASCFRVKFVGGTWSTWRCTAIPDDLLSLGENGEGTYDGSLGACTGPPNYWNALP